MMEQNFSLGMAQERERQLMLALLDCAGVCYDVNFTQNRILGTPVQVIDGVQYDILEMIGKPKNCSWTEIVKYWADRMPPQEVEAFLAFSDLERIRACYAAGERVLTHKFWTCDVKGNPMLAAQSVRLYPDCDTGDLLGLIYVTNAGEVALLQKKEAELTEQYREAANRAAFLQAASVNLPGGYHRCEIGEDYPFEFISSSFEEMTGYTAAQIAEELDNKFINLVLPEDMERFARLGKGLKESGQGNAVYRIRRRDGKIIWVQDSTLCMEREGRLCYQCALADITYFVTQQEEYARRKAEFDMMAMNIPSGYHRCTTKDGFKLDFISDSFVEIVGWTREEIREELDNQFINIVAPEDRELFMSYEPALVQDGRISVVYRVARRDGERRWVQDSTMRVMQDGVEYYQCILADITEFVRKQDEMITQHLEMMRQKILYDTMERNMPGGYHRCRAEEGCPFLYIGEHFTDIVGFTKEEIRDQFGNLYQNLLWPEDVDAITTYNDMLAMRGKGNVYDTSVYRLRHKDGGYRWVTDATMFVDMGEESFFQATISDITEYMESMLKAKQQAEASSRAKSTFLFNVSHDIRTPMNAIKGFARIISQHVDNPRVVGETITKIQQAGDSLMTLMNDVLDLARIERGKEELRIEPVHLSDLEQNLYEMFGASMDDVGIRFSLKSNYTHGNVMCDHIKLTRVAMNLLSNARKFTPLGGTVTFGIEELSAGEGCATYRFYVRDTGIGMSEDFLSRAFEQFERERTSTESGIDGSGLGLAIIKQMVELMGGTVEIRSTLAEGTVIAAVLPLALAEESSFRDDGEDLPIPDLTGKKVLLVEDNEFNREIARYILEGLGMTVHDAENGYICVGMMKTAEPDYFDLILMDIQMPVMDGYAATEAIRAMGDARANTPILAMTANAFDEDRQKCLAVGMNGHIGKPVEVSALIKALARVLQ